MPPGLMTSFNVSVGPIYSFFLPTELIAFANRPKISQNTSDFLFPETRIRLWLVLAQLAAIAWLLFSSSCLALWWAAEREGFRFHGQIHRLLEWLWLLFSPLILICKSRCIWVCINWFIACLSWKTLQILEYAKNTSSLQPFGGLSGIFPPSWLRYLSRTIAGDAPCGLAQAYRELVLNGNDLIFWGGKENCNTVGARSD